MSLRDEIQAYYQARGLLEPDAQESLCWLITELAEAQELLLTRKPGWVRNNPAAHPAYTPERFAEELGDVIMMAMRAGMAEGVDPIAALRAKMQRKSPR